MPETRLIGAIEDAWLAIADDAVRAMGGECSAEEAREFAADHLEQSRDAEAVAYIRRLPFDEQDALLRLAITTSYCS